jgi:hypothetical protein
MAGTRTTLGSRIMAGRNTGASQRNADNQRRITNPTRSTGGTTLFTSPAPTETNPNPVTNPGGRHRQQNTNSDGNNDATSEHASSSSGEEESDDDKENLKRKIRGLKKQNLDLKKVVVHLQKSLENQMAEVQRIRVDIITRSQKIVDCDPDLYSRIGDFTKQTLFRHMKFITSDAMLNDLETKTSIANITMDHFGIDDRDRIAWWRACNDALSDEICNQRNQVTQAIKAQVLST